MKAFYITLFLLANNLLFSVCQNEFVFNGFAGANLTLDGIASITPNGLLRLTNDSIREKGHAFYPSPFQFHDSTNGKILSFSTMFVFGIISGFPDLNGHGITFTISPTKDLSNALANQYLGLFNDTNNGNLTNHIFAVELDTIYSSEFGDIDDNHVGIDINSLKSYKSSTAGYYPDGQNYFKNISLTSRRAIQVWVDYDGKESRLSVTLSPLGISKPHRPSLSSIVDLSKLFLSSMYVGFSSSTGDVHTNHYILGWSFMLNGSATALDIGMLPALPFTRSYDKAKTKAFSLWLIITLCLVGPLIVALIFVSVRRRIIKYSEVMEDWEIEFGSHRFSYKELYKATNGFKEKELLGTGGFGMVYKGVLCRLNSEIAVKRVSHNSKQGLKEFISEIASLGRLRHRNIVPLLGYCRRKGELFLVYSFMPNGSLDKYLHDPIKPILDWGKRFRIIQGVASGLLYMHEEWEQVVIHRDIKASNVLLDSELNARLGDFGLARLYDRGTDPHTTCVVGTLGYLDPELARTGKASTINDVFAFGAFMLEVACGKRPLDLRARQEGLTLSEWVLETWEKGSLIHALDPRLGENYVFDDAILVMKLGLLCGHPVPSVRPSMCQVMKYLKKEVSLPEFLPINMRRCNENALWVMQCQGSENDTFSYASVSTSYAISR
ncbi:Concanavalin A-like lectin protein kinase family protein [Rhynchospora pubera]|uniref:non-specific serine/threonine protein kinase n=1 Tax=Rhynchospora pubera TaxID=906938 RepID=A0AAV8GAK7_9POAL|nr:Concanavalin A-like lectin protein kinase family protein [Rhynchospora pubera]